MRPFRARGKRTLPHFRAAARTSGCTLAPYVTQERIARSRAPCFGASHPLLYTPLTILSARETIT